MHDDSDMATVVKDTVGAIKAGARLIGKVDRRIEVDQIEEVEAAISILQKTLDLKRRMRSAPRP